MYNEELMKFRKEKISMTESSTTNIKLATLAKPTGTASVRCWLWRETHA